MKRATATKSYFTQDDDFKLLSLVNKYGTGDWNIISSLMKNKNRRQCKDRWRNYLDPSLNKDPFTDAENDIILKKVEEIGFRWKEISKYFINRTEAMVRNQFQNLSRMEKNKIKSEQKPDKFIFDFMFPFDEFVFEQIQWVEQNLD
jgi:hypothetical protein